MRPFFVCLTVASLTSPVVTSAQIPEAIALLAVNAELFPKSARALAQLAMTYEAAGQKEKVIETYKKVLVVAPNERQARARLTALGAPPPA